MRRVYETDEDIEEQKRVIALACAKWKCDFHKSDKFYPFDFFLYRGPEVRGADVTSIAEVKCRTHAHNTYKTLILSADKWLRCVEWDRILKVPFLLVVEFTDGIRWCRHRETPVLVRYEGRQDRNDKQDMELCVHIPMSEFKLLRVPA